MQRIPLICVCIILCIATLLRMFSHLDKPVERWDEQTNIAVVTNSLAHGSFPVLYLDNQPFFEKPPLWYMTTAAVVTAIDPSAISMRLVSVLAGIAIVFLTVFLAWMWWGALAGITTWIVLLGTNHLFITNPGGFFSSHTFLSADSDALQILFMIITMAACTRITHNRFLPLLAGIATGLAILTKGPLGIVPLLIATMMTGFTKKVAKQALQKAWVIALMITIPWYLYMTIRFGLPFLYAHFGYHILTRTLTPIEGHNPPPWYYVELLTNHAVFFSWEALTGSLIWITVRKIYRDPKVLYILILAAVFFVVPGFVRTRLAWYILPFYPMVALIIGIAASDVIKRTRNK